MTLENLVKLDHVVAVYVPGTSGAAEAADNAEYIRAAAARLSSAFGGATAIPAAGYWMSETHGLIEEKTVIIKCNVSAADIEEAAQLVIDIAEELKRDLRQEAVSIEVDTALYFV